MKIVNENVGKNILNRLNEEMIQRDGYSEDELSNFWKERVDSPEYVTEQDIIHILSKVQDYLAAVDRETGKVINNDEFLAILPKIIENGIEYGIDKDLLNNAVKYIKSKIIK